jgi:malate dehydrogenase
LSRKITVTGVGELPAAVAERMAARGLADILLLDSDGEAARRRAADLSAEAAVGGGSRVTGSSSWDDASGSAAVVLCGGEVAEAARLLTSRCPDAVVVVGGEPVERNCAAVLGATRFPRARVLGVAGLAEQGRLRTLVAGALQVAVRDVTALVLGGRGAAAVPVRSAARVAGIPVGDKLPAEAVAALPARLREGGAAGHRSVAGAVAEVVESVLLDQRRLLPCATLCQGELGLRGAIAGVPAIVGREGIERIVELTLADDERAALAQATVEFSY